MILIQDSRSLDFATVSVVDTGKSALVPLGNKIIYRLGFQLQLCTQASHPDCSCPGHGVKLIGCILGMTLNSHVVVQGTMVKLRPCLRFRVCG